jgi:hypothetical protein
MRAMRQKRGRSVKSASTAITPKKRRRYDAV